MYLSCILKVYKYFGDNNYSEKKKKKKKKKKLNKKNGFKFVSFNVGVFIYFYLCL